MKDEIDKLMFDPNQRRNYFDYKRESSKSDNVVSPAKKDQEFDLCEDFAIIPTKSDIDKNENVQINEKEYDFFEDRLIKSRAPAHTVRIRNQDSSTLIARDFSLLSPPIKENGAQCQERPEDEKLEKKLKKTWKDRMKQKFGKFMYKVNHAGGVFGEYNKLDFKNCRKKVIKLMGGHCFEDPKCKEDLEDIFKNIILFTYRRDFQTHLESINKKTGKPQKLKSDFGWGCMIRCGQMMIANALLLHLKYLIFRDHRKIRDSHKFYKIVHRGLSISDIKNMEEYEKIEHEVISKFLDCNDNEGTPFSIHNITEQGLESFHKIAGDWYGTNSISQVMKQLNIKHKPYEDFEI